MSNVSKCSYTQQNILVQNQAVDALSTSICCLSLVSLPFLTLHYPFFERTLHTQRHNITLTTASNVEYDFLSSITR